MRSPRAPRHRLLASRLRLYIRRHARLVLLFLIALALVVFGLTVAEVGDFYLPSLSSSQSQSSRFLMHEFEGTGVTNSTKPPKFDFVPGEESVEAWKRMPVNFSKEQEEWNRWLQKQREQLPGLNISSATNSFDKNIDSPRSTRLSGSHISATASNPLVEEFTCNRSHPQTDICLMRGNIRVKGGQQPFYKLYASNETLRRTEQISPYPRKWERLSMEHVQVIALQAESESGSEVDGRGIPSCDIYHQQPALLFSAGGFSGNVYHDFNDVLIPLFIGSSHHKGEIIFLVSDFRDWWIKRYINIIGQLTNYDLVDLGTDDRVHCFPEMIVGLVVHGQLHVDPDQMPYRETIHDFQNLLARAFRNSSTHYKPVWQTSPFQDNIRLGFPRPKLVILARLQNRMIVNEEEVVNLAMEIGFDVRVLKPVWETNLFEVYHVLQAADVMLGVHGAALTHILFLRPGCVFLQIIPIGVDLPAAQYFGDPAGKLGLQYISYKVRPEESTLINFYNSSDPIIKDSDNIAAQSWEVRRTTYMEGQDVTLSPKRLAVELRYARLLLID